ncbi:MAG: putative metal-dependent hydrolase [Myxococcota bacterium]|jgi:predicted metal-dependent hydrolase
MKPRTIDYLAGFPSELRERAEAMHADGRLLPLLQRRYPEAHVVRDNAALYTYVQDLKRSHMKSAPPLGKIRYCEKISTVHNALGLHTYAVRMQGKKLKRKNELRVGTVFRELPRAFLQMIVVHELAHLRHKDHDKAFYRLCRHMEPDYHRQETDLRLWLFATGGRAGS